jgi:hypothetical protein
MQMNGQWMSIRVNLLELSEHISLSRTVAESQ